MCHTMIPIPGSIVIHNSCGQNTTGPDGSSCYGKARDLQSSGSSPGVAVSAYPRLSIYRGYSN